MCLHPLDRICHTGYDYDITSRSYTPCRCIHHWQLVGRVSLARACAHERTCVHVYFLISCPIMNILILKVYRHATNSIIRIIIHITRRSVFEEN